MIARAKSNRVQRIGGEPAMRGSECDGRSRGDIEEEGRTLNERDGQFLWLTHRVNGASPDQEAPHQTGSYNFYVWVRSN
jgi:hypothetical protein